MDLALTVGPLDLALTTGRTFFFEKKNQKTFVRRVRLKSPSLRLEAGIAAFRRGAFMRARREFERALALSRAQAGPDHPQTLRILSDLGATHAALGEHEASRAAHDAALRGRRATLGGSHADVGVSLHNLGAALAALGENTAAIAAHAEAIAIWRASLGATHPIIARALTSLATLSAPDDAIAHLREALHIHRQAIPPDHKALAGALEALGMSHRRRGDLDAAAGYFAAALREDATSVSVRHNLAATLTRLGRAEEARPHLAAALAAQRIFVEPGPQGAPRVLVLATATDGNIPIEHLLPERHFTRIWWFIEHSPDPCAEALPPHDVVFNAMGDPDLTGGAQAPLAAFLGVNDKKLLNDPARVARTRRDLVAGLLGGIDGLRVPRTCRIGGTPTRAQVMRAAEDAAIVPPLLLRPAGAHGGAGVLRIDDWQGSDVPALPAWYITALHDCRGADGYTRKYRVIFIDRVPYPYHLAISTSWLVHYFSAEMTHAWKLAEEAAFLADMQATLGARAMHALQEAGRRLDLAYCGIDFGVAGGEIVVFEANPAMLVHPESADGPLAFKTPAIETILAAFRTMIG